MLHRIPRTLTCRLNIADWTLAEVKAIVALEHTILVIAYHLIILKEPYRELGGEYFDKHRPEATATRLVKRLEQLGYSVSLQQPALCAAG